MGNLCSSAPELRILLQELAVQMRNQGYYLLLFPLSSKLTNTGRVLWDRLVDCMKDIVLARLEDDYVVYTVRPKEDWQLRLSSLPSPFLFKQRLNTEHVSTEEQKDIVRCSATSTKEPVAKPACAVSKEAAALQEIHSSIQNLKKLLADEQTATNSFSNKMATSMQPLETVHSKSTLARLPSTSHLALEAAAPPIHCSPTHLVREVQHENELHATFESYLHNALLQNN